MILSVLNNETAIEININIMRAFVTVRQYLTSANGTIKEIEELKQRMKALEQGSEDTIAAINDLGDPDTQKLRIEYIRRDGKNIKNAPNPKNRPYFSDYYPKSLPYFWISDRMERQYLTSANGTIKEIEELKQRMKALEQGSEDTIATINDLGEDTRRELDDIYLALSQLADKQKQAPTDRKPIGFTAYDKEG